MNIASTDFTLKHNSFDIYVSGCNGPHCSGCHNPELFSFCVGKEYNQEYFNLILNKIKRFDKLIKNIMIFGGEPLDQKKEDINDLLLNLSVMTNKNIWLFTKYSFENVSINYPNILSYLHYIKCGKYDENKLTDNNIQYGIKLASSNQKIIKLN